MKYYGANKWGDDVNPEEMIHDACLATDADFSPYDWDGNGVIDVVMVVFAGYGENRGGSSDAIWPHKFNIYDDMEVGDLTLYSYACVSELDGARWMVMVHSVMSSPTVSDCLTSILMTKRYSPILTSGI